MFPILNPFPRIFVGPRASEPWRPGVRSRTQQPQPDLLTCQKHCHPSIQRLLNLTVPAKVIAFDAFTADNDPHGEHNFGAFDYAGERIFWKIDYYDEALEFGLEDPADPARTTRVLTIMLALEY